MYLPAHLDHHIRRQARPDRGPPDRLYRRRLIQAVRLPPVHRQERIQPADTLLIIDQVDLSDVHRAEINSLREPAFDHKNRHTPLLPGDAITSAFPDSLGQQMSTAARFSTR